MTRRFSQTERRRQLNARYEAMERPELRLASTPRVAPAGPHSAPIKQIDAETRALIDAALAQETGQASCPHPSPGPSPARGEGTNTAVPAREDGGEGFA